jgi:hypothetical protein
MEKHPASAAAISSSGFVPVTGASNLVLNEKGTSERTPEAAEIVPLPVFRSPFHIADALRFMTLPPLLFGKRPPGRSGTVPYKQANVIPP